MELLWAMAMAKIEGSLARGIKFKTNSFSVDKNYRAFKLQEILANTLYCRTPVTHCELT